MSSIDGSLIVLDGERATRFSTALDTTTHTSHAVKLLVGLETDVVVRESTGRTVLAQAVVIPSDRTCSVVSDGPVISLLLDPEQHREPNAVTRHLGHAAPLGPALALRLRDAVWAARQHLQNGLHLVALGDELRAMTFPRTSRPTGFDRRVERALEHFHVLLDGGDDTRIGPEQRLGITVQHLRALFLRDVGISPRAWFLWNRLVRALRAALSGSPALTAAAIGAGFSDHAHFSRTCRRLLGFRPVDIVQRRMPRDLRFVQDAGSAPAYARRNP
ncbi:helix-turn-helix domain-containing protein [Pendulispora albinea]|uniref:Helix-turn-helix domain-containing protein n=1 Tax=Pendulispora albinea TaxID=2741071 RepID=A0ABZ2MBC2_9BACT